MSAITLEHCPPSAWNRVRHRVEYAPDTPIDEFPAVQTALAKRFSGDLAVSDPSRVMRLPGFYHQKKDADPFMTLMQQGKDA